MALLRCLSGYTVANLRLKDKKKYINPSYRQSNHPSFQEKKHTLIIDAQGASNKFIKTESGTLRFENGVAVLLNDERGRDIVDELNGSHDPNVRALHPDQYALVENKRTVNVDETHRYHFGSHLAMPWATYDEHGRRVEDPDTTEEDNDGRTESGAASDPKRSAS